MEKTPRRFAPSGGAPSGGAPSGGAPSDSVPPPSGSVVVDPRSQSPSAAPPSSRSGRASASGAPASGGTRRKAEATLVLEARRVDTLRRQVVERHRAEQKGRRRQMVLWGLAGAGAVLLGGWLATRLSPKDTGQDEAPLLLGRSDDESGVVAPDPPLDSEANRAEAVDEPTNGARRAATRTRAAAAAGESAPPEEPSADAALPDSSAPAPASAAARDPDEPKVVGDWGDGFEGASSRGSHAVNLDELPTE